jgi:hypothetical protein
MFAALQNVAYPPPNGFVLKPTGFVGDRRKPIGRVWSDVRDDDLVGIGVDHQVGIVGDDDHLTLRLRRQEQPDQLVEDGFRVEVLLRLIDDQRTLVRNVERECRARACEYLGRRNPRCSARRYDRSHRAISRNA